MTWTRPCCCGQRELERIPDHHRHQVVMRHRRDHGVDLRAAADESPTPGTPANAAERDTDAPSTVRAPNAPRGARRAAFAASAAPAPRERVGGSSRSSRTALSQPTKPKLSPVRQADQARLSTKSANTSSLRRRPTNPIDADRSATITTANRLALAVDTHDPVAERVAQAGVQVEPARIGRVEQRRMAAKLEAAVAARAAVMAGKVAQRRHADAVVQLLHGRHRRYSDILEDSKPGPAAIMAPPRWTGCRSSAGPRSHGGASRTPAGSTGDGRWSRRRPPARPSGVT